MKILDKLTGKDIKTDYRQLEERASCLPNEYYKAWTEIQRNLWSYSDFSGRNLIPIMNNALLLLEETATDGLPIQEVLGDDIPGFCAALAGAAPARDYRAKWRQQLNNNVARRLGRL